MPDIIMSSANAFVSHAINSAFIPRPVLLRYIVDYKEKHIHTRPLASPHSCKYELSVRIDVILNEAILHRSS